MTTPPTPQDVREIAAKALYGRGDPDGLGIRWDEQPTRVQDFYRRRAAAVLAAVSPVIRQQERATTSEEIAEAIHWRFEHFRPEYHAAMISVAEWCEDEARRHSIQPGEET